jgi:hypothetical protein
MLQPHALMGSKLLIESEPGIALVDTQPDGDTLLRTTLWTSKTFRPGFNDFVVLPHSDVLYGLDDGILCCVDLSDGRRRWKGGRYGHGQMLLLPDCERLVILCESGEVVLVAADPDRHRELARFSAIEGKTWNHPTLVGNRLYVRNGEEMACYELASASLPREREEE